MKNIHRHVGLIITSEMWRAVHFINNFHVKFCLLTKCTKYTCVLQPKTATITDKLFFITAIPKNAQFENNPFIFSSMSAVFPLPNTCSCIFSYRPRVCSLRHLTSGGMAILVRLSKLPLFVCESARPLLTNSAQW